MIYLPDDTIPPPLYAALVESDDDYGAEVKEYLKQNGREINRSVTSLNQPTQKSILVQRHAKEIYIDPLKDCWHSFMGNIVHFVLEKHAAKNPKYYTELRMGIDMEIEGRSCHIHGKMDIYDREEEKIQDWKLTSASNMQYPKTDYERQLNVLSFIMRKRGYKVKKLEDIYLFPHLDKTKFNNPLYPRRHEQTVEVEMWSLKENRAFITDRVSGYIQESDKKDKDLTPCTDDERWIRGTYYKCFTRKKGGKKNEVKDFSSKASFKADTREEIIQLTEDISVDDKYIVELKGEPKHCGFCSAAPFCHQYQKEQAKLQKEKAY